ncbi:hypothetical protein B5C34_04320 [Pacificimonas flava]|uniref:Tetrapyrrole biosynthesis uroporphyrinogen III synthase domain-containing protein n=2 Tax=Pacificimonas TaxID=1960290 RepID=A0A219B306_9SPHN|nr:MULTISPECIES: uroporphyrinogen-III synthase [Pacificimonas]MBZ6377556.1 uroporphyrinogen-III synthase [Pacificimonas aurantium]OWV32752.1 hypothetical protein B5C34_04320 [Pacificimonas flava]
MKILLTRPRPAAEETARRLRSLGHEVTLSPLLQIEPVRWTLPAKAVQAAAATSANAFRGGVPAELKRLPLYAVGAATAEAARLAGFRHVDESAGDAASLFARLRAEAPGRLLYLSGETVSRPMPHDILHDRVVTYRAAARRLDRDAEEQLRTGTIDMALCYSARTLAHFAKECARLGIQRESLSLALLGKGDPGDLEGWRALHRPGAPTEDALFAAAHLLCEDDAEAGNG